MAITSWLSHVNHRSFYFLSTLRQSRQVMEQYGDGAKKLWPTEFGWGSATSPHPGYEYEARIDEATQAKWIVDAFNIMAGSGYVAVPMLWNLNYPRKNRDGRLRSTGAPGLRCPAPDDGAVGAVRRRMRTIFVRYGESSMSEHFVRKHLTFLVVGLIMALALAACGGGEEPTATPTKTPIPQQSAQEPTPTATVAPAVDSGTQAAAPTAAPAPPAEPTATPAPVIEKIARVAASQLNIREQPDLNANIVKLALEGEEYSVVSTSDDGQWTQLGENGAPLGWGAAEFLTVEERVVQSGAADGTSSPTGDATAAPSQPTAAPACRLPLRPRR